MLLHRQRVHTVSIHCVWSRPGGAGNVTFMQPRQILRAMHCIQRKSFPSLPLPFISYQYVTQCACLVSVPPSLPHISFCFLHFPRFHFLFRLCVRWLYVRLYRCKCVGLPSGGNHDDRSSSSLRRSCGRIACSQPPGRPDIRQSLRS